MISSPEVTQGALLLAVTIDGDPDRFDPSQGQSDLSSWRGVGEGIPQLLDDLNEIGSERIGESISATIFVRCDSGVERQFGTPAGLLERYADLWREVEGRGHELGYHPHFEEGKGVAGSEMDVAELRSGLQAMQERGYSPVASRLGEARATAPLLAALANLGMDVDSTAMPGRHRMDGHRSIDWRGTPRHPFRPSRKDYRRPGPDPMEILEIPMTMVETKAPYDDSPLMRYTDLTFHHEILAPGLDEVIREASLIVTTSHPSTILPDLAGDGHGLLSYSRAVFKKNLTFLIERAHGYGREVVPVTLSGAAAAWSERRHRD